MDALNARLDTMMHMMAEAISQQLVTEETLQKNQAHLEPTAGQENPASTQPIPAPAPVSNPIVLAKPQPFNGTHFPTNASKVAFTIPFMKDYAATWSQPYLDKVFNGEPLVFHDFLNEFKSSFVDHNHRHCAKVALWNLRHTGIVLAYTQYYNKHTCTVGWANTPLMSLYQHAHQGTIFGTCLESAIAEGFP
ncbi:uncharacterized protein VP01_553g11 [Puccinia sorghi]|uniref:Retrotransposon gag domain-containing protein n=1 Tax=Puccinia sorghi TaxID=27349 RepID=A0A0L6UJB5_9BASI|nr:uncharacterized protein VP01_553g11 [Puccinia sorghi]